MAKTVSVSLDHEFTSRGESMTVKQALAWVEDTLSEEGEDGESDGPRYTPGDLIVYAVRRMMALHKDSKRFGAGKKPARIYTPRVKVQGAAKNADQVKEDARERFAKVLHLTWKTATKPVKAGKPTKAAKPAKVEKAAK